MWSFLRVMGFVWLIFLLYINQSEGNTKQICLEDNRNGSEASLIFDVSWLLSPSCFFSSLSFFKKKYCLHR